jgi:hypothetical protein
MDNIDRNLLDTTAFDSIARGCPEEYIGFFQWLQAMQKDMQSLPSVSALLNGNFPSTPESGIGLLFLTSGTYEVAGTNSWRRLYDGALFATGVVAP